MQWKTVSGYEGYYEVSDTGLVRGLDRIVPDESWGTRFIPGKMMKQTEMHGKNRKGDGYFVVNLRKEHTSWVAPVHRLVAETFIPNKDNLPTVNHKDGNKHNNNVWNLEWASYADNNIHALTHHLRQPRGNAVAQVSNNGVVIATFRSVCEASRQTGINRSLISHCVNGRVKSAGGYHWIRIEKCNDYSNNGSTVEDELPLEARELQTQKI